MEIVVVTKVPAPGDGGNLAMAGLDLHWIGERDERTYLHKTIPFLDALKQMLGNDGQAVNFLLNMREPVFTLGEVMFLDDAYGREIIGAGRKPNKWSVEVETVDTIEEAIALSLRVTTEAQEAK